MICPVCNTDGDRVIDSRPAPDGKAIRRRRECLACGNRFTTYEQVEAPGPTVIKADGRRENFDPNKILNGLQLAVKKRPVSKERLQAVVTDVTIRIKNDFPNEIPTSQIGEIVLNELLKLDEVAYVRFASVHKQFSDKDEFLTVLRSLPASLQVVKSNGRYEPFKREKLISSLKTAVKKRPVPHKRLEKIADDIIQKLANRIEVSSSELANTVMDNLKQLDEVAYVRYAALYKHFVDAAELAAQPQEIIEPEESE